MTTTAEVNEFTGRLAELVKQVQAGNEVVLTQERKPVARIISTSSEPEIIAGAKLEIQSLKGHHVLTPVISQSELADEMFGRP
jgi:prevent-host-death family protein